MKRGPWRLSLLEPVVKASKAEAGAGSPGEAIDVEAAPNTKVVPAGGKKELERTVQHLCKLSLQSASNLRQVAAVVFTNAIVLATKTCIVTSLAAGKNYNAQVNAIGKGHGLGSPHLHKGLGFLEGMSEEPEVVNNPLLTKDLIHLVNTLNGQTQLSAETFLSHFKTSEVYNAVKTEPSKVRVEFAFHGFEEVEETMGSTSIDGACAYKIVMQCLVAIGAEMKSGTAPRSNNEREVSTALDRLNKLIK